MKEYNVKEFIAVDSKEDLIKNGHGAVVCQYCSTILSNCRCKSKIHPGIRQYTICDKCNLNKIASQLEKIAAYKEPKVIYNVYGLEGKSLSFKNREDLINALKKKGIKHTGESKSHGLRKTLQNQPKFDKLTGPMSDGGNKIRYETGELYKQMST